MEVNHERLPSLASFDLIAVRGTSEPASRPSFRECLQPGGGKSRVQLPDEVVEHRVADQEANPPLHERPVVENTHDSGDETVASSQQDEFSDDEQSDEGVLTSEQIVATPLPNLVADNVIPGQEVAEIATAIPEETAASGDPETPALPVEPTAAVAPSTPTPGADLADVQNDTAIEPEATQPSEKSKRLKIHQTISVDPVEPTTDPETAGQPGAKRDIPNDTIPLNTTILGPPHVAPLELSQEDSDGSPAAEVPAEANVVDLKPAPAVAESAGVAPASDQAASAQQETTNPAGTAAMTPKPPAVFLKTKAGHADTTHRGGEIDPAKFLSRVFKAFESAHQRGSEVRLRLHPAELGALSIEVKVQDSVLTARVQAETSEAKAAIIDNLPALRERLAEQGIRIDKFDVDLMDHSDRRQQSLDEQNRQQEARQAATPRSPSRRAVNVDQPAAPPARNRTSGPGGLNVVI